MSMTPHPPIGPLDPGSTSMMELFKAGAANAEEMTIEQRRERYDTLLETTGLTGSPAVRAQDLFIRKVPVRFYRPPGVKPKTILPGVQFMHGGAGLFGSIKGYDNFCRILCERSHCAVVSVGYRLAPEELPPADIDDCLDVFQYITSPGGGKFLSIDNSGIGLVGDSYGGNLVVSLCILLQKKNLLSKVRFQMPIQAVLCTQADRRKNESYRSCDGPEFLLTHQKLEYYAKVWDKEPTEDRLPLVKKSFADFPPAAIFTGAYDPLRDEGYAYHERLLSDGCTSKYICYDSIHVFFLLGKSISLADAALTSMSTHLQNGMSKSQSKESGPKWSKVAFLVVSITGAVACAWLMQYAKH